jgi:hypothetical protein
MAGARARRSPRQGARAHHDVGVGLVATTAELSCPPQHATAAATFHCEPIQRCGGLRIPLHDRILAQRRCRRARDRGSLGAARGSDGKMRSDDED